MNQVILEEKDIQALTLPVETTPQEEAKILRLLKNEIKISLEFEPGVEYFTNLYKGRLQHMNEINKGIVIGLKEFVTNLERQQKDLDIATYSLKNEGQTYTFWFVEDEPPKLIGLIITKSWEPQ